MKVASCRDYSPFILAPVTDYYTSRSLSIHCNQFACCAGNYLYRDWCILFTQHLFIADNENEPDESKRAEPRTSAGPEVVYSVLLIRPLQIPNVPVGKVWHDPLQLLTCTDVIKCICCRIREIRMHSMHRFEAWSYAEGTAGNVYVYEEAATENEMYMVS